MNNTLMIDKSRLNYMKIPYSVMILLDFCAIDCNDGYVEVLKNRYNGIHGMMPKSEFLCFIQLHENKAVMV